MRVVTDDVKAVLEAGGLTVGDGTGDGLTVPYVVLYPLGDGFDAPGFGGSLAKPWGQLDGAYQATCVGASREQAEWLADRVYELMVADTSLGWVQLEPSGPVRRDDTTAGPPLFYATPGFSVHTEGLT